MKSIKLVLMVLVLSVAATVASFADQFRIDTAIRDIRQEFDVVVFIVTIRSPIFQATGWMRLYRQQERKYRKAKWQDSCL